MENGQSWKEYFETHPEFAALDAPRFWSPEPRNGRTMLRMYFGESYLQRVITEQCRSGNTYYDQHRMSKGDTHEVISDEKVWFGDEALRNHLLTISDAKDLADLWQKLVGLNSRPKRKRQSRRAA